MRALGREHSTRWPLAVPAVIAFVHVALLLVVTRDGTVTVAPLRDAIAGVGPAIASVVPPPYEPYVRAVAAADWFPVVLLEIILTLLVAATLLFGQARRRSVAAFVLALVVLTAVAGVSLTSGAALWLVVGSTVGAVALLAYGLHRYERVVLGLVKGGSEA